MRGAFSIPHRRSLPKLLLRLKRYETLLARKKAHSFLYDTNYYDSEKAEVVARANVEVPNIATKVVFGIEVQYVAIQSVERGDVLKDSRGTGLFQTVIPQKI